MRRHGQADFGNTMAHLGQDESNTGQPDVDSETQKGEPNKKDDSGMGCSKGMCDGMAMAAKTALTALGPASQPISQQQLGTMSQDKSPTGQAAYQAALDHNAEVNKQNAERQAIIDQFVKDAIGGQVTKEQMQLGDAAHVEYEKIVKKYGEDTRYLTLSQLVAKYPADAKNVIASLGQVFPAFKGKSFEQIWAIIPQTFKDMQLIDLEHAIPSSSWIGSVTTSGKKVAPGVSTLALGGLGLVAVAGLAFLFLRKKGSNAPQQ